MSYGICFIPRGSSWLVNLPCRRSCAVMMCSNVDSQCVSNTRTASGSSRSRHSLFIRCRPGTSVISLPSLISRRTSSGSMIVGTCATSAAPTTSPMSEPLPVLLASGPRGRAHVLDVRIEVEAVHTALAADARGSRAAERRTKIPDEEAVDPHGAGDDPARDAIGAVLVAGVQARGEPVLGLVRQRDRLLLGLER